VEPDETVACVAGLSGFKSSYFWVHVGGYGEAERTLYRKHSTGAAPGSYPPQTRRNRSISSRKTAACDPVICCHAGSIQLRQSALTTPERLV